MTSLAHPPRSAAPASVPDTFDARCARLRLFPFHFDVCGNLQRSPTLPVPLETVLVRGGFDHILKAAASAAITGTLGDHYEVAAGCWAFPVMIRRAHVLTGMMLAVGFDPWFPKSAWFAQMCGAAGVSVDDAAAAMAPLLREFRHTAADLGQSLPWMYADLVAAAKTRSTLDEFSGKLAQAYEEVNFLFRLARFLNHIDNPLQLMGMLLQDIHAVLPFGWVAIRFSDRLAITPELQGKTMLRGNPPCERQALDAAAREMLDQWTADGWTRMLAPGGHPLATQVRSEVLAEPIVHGGSVIGVLLAGNKSGDDADLASTEMQFADAIAHFIGVFHENIARFAEQRALFLGTVKALTSAIDAKDPYTRGHSERVGLLAAAMARALGLPDADIERYRLAGLVHDVGKIGVPEAVLRKPAQLTDEEFAEIKKHPAIGHAILREIPQMQAVLPGVLHHHERWDGKGYPQRLAGKDIPYIARVLALADTFDAMSSHRAYRTARPRKVVLEELLRCAGRQYDPDLVPVFTSLDFSEFDAALNRVQDPQT
ncbi:MAG TPA: HD domain-containing phosphohydrolase [Phycisphaerae bacterium]|nr:HD domain-containing phosphohydrolase [Phycisphaerae bacterium]